MNEEEVIRQIGDWFKFLSLHALSAASERKAVIDKAVSDVGLTNKTQAYYNLVDFRHQLTLGGIVHQPEKQKKFKFNQTISETDSVIQYLYHYMEGTISFNTEDYGVALSHYRMAEKSLDTVNEFEQAEFYYRMGCNLYRIDQNIIAMNYLTLATEVFMKSDAHLRKELNCKMIMAGVYSDAGSFRKAHDLLDDVLQESISYPYLRSLALRNKALVDDRQCHYDRAITHFHKALDIQEHRNTVVSSKTKYNLANIYLKKGEYDEGLVLLNEVEASFHRENLKEYQARCRITRGLYENEHENTELIDSGLKILEESNLLYEKAEVSNTVADHYKGQEKYDYAFHFLEIATDARNQQNLIGVESI